MTCRRSLLLAAAAAAPGLAAAVAAQAPGTPPQRGKTDALVHGCWTGGWLWAPVAERLRDRGHRVFTPSQTGPGDRRHLLSRAITIDTFVADIANLLEAEELREVILVGHSFGGIPISGVADRMPERIRHLVYLDAVVVGGGKSFFDSNPPEVVAGRRKAAEGGRHRGAAATPGGAGRERHPARAARQVGAPSHGSAAAGHL